MQVVDVCIVGGGLGGLALAAGLFHRGHDAHVFEAAPELRTATGTLIALAGNSFTALERLHPDIVPKVKACGAQRHVSVMNVRPSRDQPNTVTRRPADPKDDPLYTIRWSEVQRVLAELVPSAHVHCNHKATGYTELVDEGYVLVHFKGQPDVKARLVVGADGVRSALRAQMVPNDPGIRYLGVMGWNALLYNPNNSVVDVHGPGEIWTFTDNQNNWTGTWTRFSMVADAGGGWTSFHVSIPSETPAPTLPPAEDATAAGNGNAAGGAAAGNGVAAGSAATGNGVAAGSAAAGDGAAAGSAAAGNGVGKERPNLVWGGLGRPGSKARVMAVLKEAGFDDCVRVLKCIPEADLFERCAVDRVPLDEVHGSMSSPGKRVVLLGDAAHAMYVGPGQGARSAFEDAHTLVAMLEQQREQLVGWQLSASSLPDSNGINSDLQQELQAGLAQLSLQEGPAGVAGDAAAVFAAVSGYEHLRLTRTCRFQRFSAEGAMVPEIRNQLRPKDMEPEQRMARAMEFFKWASQYPKNPTGDPALTYWKPEARAAEVQPQVAKVEA